MENSGVTVMVNVEKKKSNAAWICGLIGFITSLPNSFCAMICAGVSMAVEESAGDDGSGSAGYFWFIVLVSILCFALSFMGKSKNSFVTGLIVLLGGIFILINGFIGFGSMLWGTATGGLYIASGIVSILNKKRAN